MLDIHSIEELRLLFPGVLGLIGLGCIAALVYGLISKRFTDKLVAVNLVTVLSVNATCMLAAYLKQEYILDIALVYALLSFVAVVVLSKLLTEKNRGGSEE